MTDYGPGKALTIELLAAGGSPGSVHAVLSDAAGLARKPEARRGCAVIGVGLVAAELARIS